MEDPLDVVVYSVGEFVSFCLLYIDSHWLKLRAHEGKVQ